MNDANLNAIERTTSPVEPVKRRGVVGVVVRGESYLVIKRSEHVVAPGRLCFPGGGIEGDETEEAAIVREMQEELGVAVRVVRRLWRCETKWSLTLAWWQVEIEEGLAILPNPLEVAEVEWLSSAELALRESLLDSNFAFLAAIQSGEATSPWAPPAGENA